LIFLSGLARTLDERIINSTVVLRYNTTWGCGRLQREIIDYLRRHNRKARVKEILEHYAPIGQVAQRFITTIKKLEDRLIIKIE